MNIRLLAGALLALGAPIIASAQCPAGVTPDTYLVGKNFAFSVAGTKVAAIGTFMGFANGYLAITETVVDTSGSNSQVISRLAPASGRWMADTTEKAGNSAVFPPIIATHPCTTGMIQFMLNREFYSFTYTVNTSGQLVLVGRDENYVGALAPVQHYVVTGCVGPTGTTQPPLPPINQGNLTPSCTNQAMGSPVPYGPPTDVARIAGTAYPNPPKACPVGLGNPLNILKGAVLVGSLGLGDTYAAIATFLNPAAYSGDLTIIRKISGSPQMNPSVPDGFFNPNLPANWFTQYPAEITYGRYIIYSDCSGGELLFMGGRGIYRQVEFVFTDGTFRSIVGVVDGSPAL